MVLPLSMLFRIQISARQKIGLALIFSIAIVTIALDIVRTVESISGGAFGYISLYCILETTLTVIISSLPVYRGLVSYVQKRKYDRYPSDGFEGQRHLVLGEKGTGTLPVGAAAGSYPTSSDGSKFSKSRADAIWCTRNGHDPATSRGTHEGYNQMGSREVIPQSEV